MRGLIRCAGAAALVWAAGGAWAEPVEIKASLPVGRVVPIEIEYSLEADQTSPDGAAQKKSVRQTALVRFEVEEVADDGSAVLKGSVERLSLEWSRGEERGEFMRPRITADVPADTPLNTALEALGSAMFAAPIQMVVSPDGRVEAIRGLNDVLMALNDPAVRGDEPIPLVDASALGVFGGRQFAALSGSAFTGDGAGREPREVGETWETTESIPAPPAGTILLDTAWTTTAIDKPLVTFTGVSTVSIAPPPGDDPTAPRGEIAQQASTVTMIWNLDAGLMDERVSVQRLVTNWSMAGMTLQQTQTSTMKLKRLGD